jgi:ubiquitin carboxyl-terminal hydrolase 4/11/15
MIANSRIDSSVGRQNAEGVVSTAAYLLFYRRRSPTPLGPAYLQELVLKARNHDEASEAEDESGEGERLGDHSSATSRLLGSSNAGAVEAGARITGTLQQGASAGGPGRGASQAVRLMNEVDDDEGISLNDEVYGNTNKNNNTAVTLANPEATWGFEGLGEDDNTTSVNTPADTASDRPDVGSDIEDRFMDLDHDEYDNEDLPQLTEDNTMFTGDQGQFDESTSSAHEDG